MMKIFEEHIVRYFAEEKGLPATVLRLIGPLTAAEWEEIASAGTGKAGDHHAAGGHDADVRAELDLLRTAQVDRGGGAERWYNVLIRSK